MAEEKPKTMKIATSYTVDLVRQLNDKGKEFAVDAKLMKGTSDLCLEALNFCVKAFLECWDELLLFSGKYRNKCGENLVHSTKTITAKYPEFDKMFPKMPSGICRAVVAKALGIISSYKSNHKNWEAEDPATRGKEPTLGMPNRYELTFYGQERNTDSLPDGILRLKLWNGKSWEWYSFKIKCSDATYIAKLAKNRKLLSPIIDKVRGKYCVRFCFIEERVLVQNDNPLEWRILSVDLGINSPASWCVMEADGTVHARGVIHARVEEDHLNHLINRKRVYQQAGKKSHSIYRRINAANEALSIQTAKRIMQVAELYSIDCVAFEHLDLSGKKKGRFKERLHMWRAKDVQERVELMAHRNCMRISRVCAWGTSRLAFDGSGKVLRGKEASVLKGNYSICKFPSGKIYNCDINAALNIGARFFLRLYAGITSMELPKTPQRTYSTLLMLVENLFRENDDRKVA